MLLCLNDRYDHAATTDVLCLWCLAIVLYINEISGNERRTGHLPGAVGTTLIGINSLGTISASIPCVCDAVVLPM